MNLLNPHSFMISLVSFREKSLHSIFRMENAHWKTTAVCFCVCTNFHDLSEAAFKIPSVFLYLNLCSSYIW